MTDYKKEHNKMLKAGHIDMVAFNPDLAIDADYIMWLDLLKTKNT